MSRILFKVAKPICWIIQLYTNKWNLDNSGENVEPVVLEEAVLRSRAIQQIIVIGQVERTHIPFSSF